MATQLGQNSDALKHILEIEKEHYRVLMNSEASIFLQLVKTLMSGETGPIGNDEVQRFIDFIQDQKDFALLVEKVFPIQPNPVLKALLIHELNNLLVQIKTMYAIFSASNKTLETGGNDALERNIKFLKGFYNLSKSLIDLLVNVYAGIYPGTWNLVANVVPVSSESQISGGKVITNEIAETTLNVTVDENNHPDDFSGAENTRYYMLAVRTLIDNAFKELSIESLHITSEVITDEQSDSVTFVANLKDDGTRIGIISERIAEAQAIALTDIGQIEARSGLKLVTLITRIVGGSFTYMENPDGTKQFEIKIPAETKES